MYIWIIFMLLGVFLDQISKYLVVLYMDLHQSVEIIPGVFNFTYIQNEGAAFGSMTNSRWVFMIMSSIMIIGILVFMFWKKPKSKLLLSALTLIVAGGIGNMIDRIRLGYVIDFLDFCAFPKLWMWTFNVADSFVVVGAGLMILWMILDTVRDRKAEKSKNSEEAQDKDNSEGETVSASETVSESETVSAIENVPEIETATESETASGSETGVGDEPVVDTQMPQNNGEAIESCKNDNETAEPCADVSADNECLPNTEENDKADE